MVSHDTHSSSGRLFPGKRRGAPGNKEKKYKKNYKIVTDGLKINWRVVEEKWVTTLG
jgi:hypothetical protein